MLENFIMKATNQEYQPNEEIYYKPFLPSPHDIRDVAFLAHQCASREACFLAVLRKVWKHRHD